LWENKDESVCFDVFDKKEHIAFFGVYDGHGGKQAVKYTAEHLHLNVAEALKDKKWTEEDMAAVWKTSFLATDEAMKNEKISYSGTTVVTALIVQEKTAKHLFVANVGDARAVLNRGDTALRLTIDHKGSVASEVERIKQAGGFVVLNRVNGMLAVTRSLGDHTMKDFVIGEPDCKYVTLTPTDDVLILACDGLWDVISDEEACKMASSMIKEGKTPQEVAKELLRKALTEGSTDNISITVVVL